MTDYETLAQQNAALQAEVERLTKERDEALTRAAAGQMEMRARASKLCTWHSETLVASIKGLPIWSDAQAALDRMLADAERDMRQRAADVCASVEAAHWDKWKEGWDMIDQGASDGAGECESSILALPLKHADREGGV